MSYRERKEAARQRLIEQYEPMLSTPWLSWQEVANIYDEIDLLCRGCGLALEARENGLL
jgi:hypothetical protein